MFSNIIILIPKVEHNNHIPSNKNWGAARMRSGATHCLWPLSGSQRGRPSALLIMQVNETPNREISRATFINAMMRSGYWQGKAKQKSSNRHCHDQSQGNIELTAKGRVVWSLIRIIGHGVSPVVNEGLTLVVAQRCALAHMSYSDWSSS